MATPAESLEGRAFMGRGWSFPVAPEAGGEVRMSEYDRDVEEAVRIVLATDWGERVMRPDFGANLGSLVFAPVTTTTMALVRNRVEQALVQWEPRIDVEEVDVTTDPAVPGRLDVTVSYRVRATNTFYNLVYPFYLIEGQPE
jgi:uncharacterized protein